MNKNIHFLDLFQQQKIIKDDIDASISRVLKHGKYIMGPEITELEGHLCEYTGAKFCITCASGTDALLLALLALNIGEGDAVICPSFTFPATAEAIILAGAKPIFVDVSDKTYNICYKDIISVLDKNSDLMIKAIMPVDLFGLPANYKKLKEIAVKYDLSIISDAAQSFGGIFENQKVGVLSDITCTSFFPAKPLGCYGDGGALFTNDPEIRDKLISLRAHGKGKEKYEILRIGLNSRLDTIQAAILINKMKILDWEIRERDRIAKIYNEAFKDYFEVPAILQNSFSAWAQYTIRVRNRDKLVEFLKELNIPSMIYYPVPMHLQPAYLDYGKGAGSMPVSEKISGEVLSIPVHPYLHEEQQEYIIENLVGFIKK